MIKTASVKSSLLFQASDLAGGVSPVESAVAALSQTGAATAPGSLSAATDASQKLFAMLDQNAAMQSYRPYGASPVHRILPADMVDATFTADDLLWHDETLQHSRVGVHSEVARPQEIRVALAGS